MLNKGTGSELKSGGPAKHNRREVPVPLSFYSTLFVSKQVFQERGAVFPRLTEQSAVLEFECWLR